MRETFVATILSVVVGIFLCGFWLAPGGVLALRRRAGELQPDVRLGYSPSTLYRLLDAYGEEGRREFRRLLLADMVFPVIYAVLLYSLADLLASDSMRGIAQGAAIAGAALDYVENVSLLVVVRRFPSRSNAGAKIAAVSTSLKMAAIAISVAGLAIHHHP